MGRESGVSRCKLLHLEWVSNGVLLYSIGNYVHSLGLERDERWYEKKNIYITTGSLFYTAEIKGTL